MDFFDCIKLLSADLMLPRTLLESYKSVNLSLLLYVYNHSPHLVDYLGKGYDAKWWWWLVHVLPECVDTLQP